MKPLSGFWIIGLTLTFLAAAAWFGMRIYAVISTVNVSTVRALYTNDELFIFIGHGTSGLTGVRAKLWLEEATSVLHSPESITEDLLVVHVNDGRVSKYDLKGFDFGGSPFVTHGHVYWARGRSRGETGPNKWKWDGFNFLALSETEASLLDYDHVKDIDVATRAEGWAQTSFVGAQMTCKMQGNEIRIFAKREPISAGIERVQVSLVQPGKTNSAETLIDVEEGYRQISRDEYLRIKSESTSLKGSAEQSR